MVYHDSTAIVFSKEVQNQMQLSLNTKSPSSSSGSNGMLALDARHDAGNIYATMQNANLHTNFKAKSPAFIQQVDIMPATLTAVTPTPPPPPQSPTTTTTTTTSTTTATTQKSRGKSSGNKVQFKCELCGMTFGSKSAHTSHTKSHANKGEISNNKYPTESQHQDVDVGKQLAQIKANPNAVNGGGGDPYQCNVCQKTFAVPARLIRHYRTHTGERPFECEFCHKLFSVKENLQVHRRIHTKERPYKCEVCGRAFEHSGKLHRHMRIHTGERPHKCSVCEKTFIQSGQLVIHMRTHTGEKPYKCPVEGCGKGFTCSKQLKVHSRTHTGEKPYHCDICFRDFGYNHVLKLHRVQHYGSKCYKCTICDETFKGKKEMEAHIKGHANELPSEEGAEGGDATVASTGSSTASDSNGGHIKSESISSELEVLDNAVSNLLEHSNGTSLVGLHDTSSLLANSSTLNSAQSPLSSSMSASYVSVGSPALSGTSSNTTIGLDSGDNSSYHSEPKALQAVAVFPTMSRAKPTLSSYGGDDLPTDLSIQQELKQAATTTPSSYYQNDAESAEYDLHGNLMTNLQNSRNYHMSSPSSYSGGCNALAAQPVTINPALLEAASIASRSVMLESREHEATEAALQILQLNRSLSPPNEMTPLTAHSHGILPSALGAADASHMDDMYEANELISHYKRGDLAKHGIHKGYVPVPKFESSLRNNDHILRKVEAAIAPLRTSTESPERSSSPESDCMMMADRDIMTLPLRKRKIYMSDKDKGQSMQDEHGNNMGMPPNADVVTDMGGMCEMNTKVVRMSSVIQFAKAS